MRALILNMRQAVGPVSPSIRREQLAFSDSEIVIFITHPSSSELLTLPFVFTRS
jgi:hypothetical protein